MSCYELIIKGRVQGVSYRYFAWKAALQLGIKGYVKNLYNGDVLIVAKASEQDINGFMEKLKIGPSMAIVKAVIKTEIESCENYRDFKIIY